MRLLFIGNAASPLVSNLALELKRLRPGLVVDAISEAPCDDGHSSVFDHVVTPEGGGWARRTRGFKFFWYAWKYRQALARLQGTYDVVHVFYLSAIWGVLSRQLRKRGRRVLVTLFGSDVYRTNAVLKRFQLRLLDVSDGFSVSNPHTMQVARSVFGRPLSPCRELLFGLRSLDHLNGIGPEDVRGSRARFNIPPDRVVVACGYNGSPNQNHGSIIRALAQLDEALRARCFLVVPMTTGGTEEYRSSVHELLTSLNLPFLMLTERLEDKDVAQLRMATDILIQVQTTDQLSGSMLEHLFAGNVLITGAWLPYELMKDHGLVYWTTESHELLSLVLSDCIRDLEARKQAAAHNRELVWMMTSWSHTAPRWSALYD